TGGTATASLKVEGPPSFAKAFNPAAVALNATTSLTFTITNPAANADPLTGVAFTDTLPAGLTVANATAPVCGGTVTTTAPSGISMTGATVAVNSQCPFNVTVTGAVAGSYTNTTGAIGSTNGGAGNTASASLVVGSPDLSIAKSHSGIFIQSDTGKTYSITVSNVGSGASSGTVTVVDTMPAGL